MNTDALKSTAASLVAKGKGILAIDASLWSPYGVATDSEGNVYIADTKNHIIRKVAR